MPKKILVTVPGCNIPVYDNGDGSFTYTAHMMIDGDGVGPSHGDPDYQNSTSYKPDLNADFDPYFVLPPCVFLAVGPEVMGCQGQIKRISTNQIVPAFPGDVGPHTKLGEAAIACARSLGVPCSPVSGGSDDLDFEYTFWPGVPAVIDGKTYILQPYR